MCYKAQQNARSRPLAARVLANAARTLVLAISSSSLKRCGHALAAIRDSRQQALLFFKDYQIVLISLQVQPSHSQSAEGEEAQPGLQQQFEANYHP